MSGQIRVAVAGHRGRVGSVLVPVLQNEPGIEYVGGIDRGDNLADFLKEKRPRVLVDFTKPAEASIDRPSGLISTYFHRLVRRSSLRNASSE